MRMELRWTGMWRMRAGPSVRRRLRRGWAGGGGRGEGRGGGAVGGGGGVLVSADGVSVGAQSGAFKSERAAAHGAVLRVGCGQVSYGAGQGRGHALAARLGMKG